MESPDLVIHMVASLTPVGVIAVTPSSVPCSFMFQAFPKSLVLQHKAGLIFTGRSSQEFQTEALTLLCLVWV